MKRLFVAAAVLILFMVLSCAGTASAQSVKIGVYDSNRILRESKTIEGYNKELMKTVDAKRPALTAKENALKALNERYRKDGATMSAADRKAMEERLINEDKELRRMREDLELEVRKVQAELRQKALVDINDAIKKIGEREKYDVIFEKNNAGIVYLKDAMDITNKIIGQMK